MSLCARHSHDLSAVLRRKGLGALIRPEAARQSAELWLKGQTRPKDFDPYVVSALEIFSKCNQLSIYVIKDACHLCTAAAALRKDELPDAWIDNVTDLMAITARTNGLV